MTANDLGRQLAAWVDQRIEEMLGAPGMWGTCLEAVEMQVLTLLEVRALALDVERELAQPRRVLDKYVRLLGERFKGPPRPAFQAVGEPREETFVALLRELSASLREPAPEDDDDFFSRIYLGMELRFAPGQFLSTQAVTGFYEDFRRATRSLARLGTGRTGRVEKEIENASDFVLESVQITPLNGVPARARLALGAPYGQLSMPGERVHRALGQILDAAARADAQGEEVLAFGEGLDEEERTRALMQTMRILPRGGIEEVTIGGTFVERAPVRLRKIHAPKLMAAVAEDMKPTLYDQTALIRAIDLDRGALSHGNASKNRITVYLPAALSDLITQVGVRARIVGNRYEPRTTPAFVLAEQIEVLGELPKPAVRPREART